MQKVVKLFIVLWGASFITACEKEDEPSGPSQSPDCQITEQTEAQYSWDATHIFYRGIGELDTQHVDYYKPRFNPSKVRTILRDLQVISDNSSPYRDTVFDILQIHVYPHKSAQIFTIQADPNSPEYAGILADQPTGNAIYDSIHQAFGIEKRGGPSTSNWVDFRTDTLYNLYAITEKLQELDFINHAFPSGFIGDGGNISREITPEGRLYTFTYGWGDCPAGCIHKRHWEFKVTTRCPAEFVRSYGDPLPQ